MRKACAWDLLEVEDTEKKIGTRNVQLWLETKKNH
jgi:hypothetical protein